MKPLWFAPVALATLATPASAQEIKLKELVDTTITSTVWHAGTVRSEGKEYSAKVKSDVEIVVGKWGDPVQFVQTATWIGNNGRSFTATFSESGLPGKVSATSAAGSGHAVGFLQDGTLYLIRTLKAGGFKFEFKLSRTSKGLTCASREIYLKERGTAAIRLDSPRTGRPLYVVNDKQISSTCRVIKR
jgi:hypothetical protein